MWTGDLQLRDINGQNLAVFMALRGDRPNDPDRIRGWPTTALFAIFQLDADTPLWVWPGIWHTTGSFLLYLAGIAGMPGDRQYAPEIDAKVGGMYEQETLDRSLTVGRLAAVTGFPAAEVREVLAGHLTFPAPDGELSSSG